MPDAALTGWTGPALDAIAPTQDNMSMPFVKSVRNNGTRDSAIKKILDIHVQTPRVQGAVDPKGYSNSASSLAPESTQRASRIDSWKQSPLDPGLAHSRAVERESMSAMATATIDSYEPRQQCNNLCRIAVKGGMVPFGWDPI